MLQSAIIALALMLLPSSLKAQHATIRETKESFPTYPFSDPNPIARMSNIYPYFRFDGYSDKPVIRDWKIVTLENPYIKVLVAPEIGGKILGAFEKSSGREFIYFNKVVKFREIAMRGPWTSGGIEFNFGEIGHAPTVATPVDYLTRTNEDGSVSCIVGSMDLASRTEWRVEIRLPKDKAFVETHSFWYNPMDLPTSLYHWSTAAGDATPDLHFEYPGSAYIDHGGNAYPYPIDAQGRTLSSHAVNAFGSNKSFHVLGVYTDYFGARWANDDFGVIHWSRYGDKPGKKIWQWAQSREGAIWTDLLTDPKLGNKQYMEFQSGLLFNQAAGNSSLTPFKHLPFPPMSEERFSETWFPFMKIGGVKDANPHGTLNVTRIGSTIRFGICPLEHLDAELKVIVVGEPIYSKRINLKPLQSFTDSVTKAAAGDFEVIVGDRILQYKSVDEEEKRLRRPIQTNPDFDWNSVAGLAIDGAERAKQRDYHGSLEKYQSSLKIDPAYPPALVGTAEAYYRRMEYDSALVYITKALTIDTYDPEANFIYGLVSKSINRWYDARDAFSLASRSTKFRSSANVQIAELAFLDQRWDQALEYGNRGLDYDRYSVRANRLLALAYRKMGNSEDASKILNSMLALDPLCHFARFEKYLQSGRNNDLRDFNGMIRNELPSETYLELAAYYVGLGLNNEAISVLEQSPPHPMVSYWLANFLGKAKDSQRSRSYLEAALVASPRLVFPFRSEDLEVLQWAELKSPHWKTKYYLGLAYWSKDRPDLAKQLFADCGDHPDFWAFYVVRGNLLISDNPMAAEKDYLRAAAIEPNEWRIARILADFYNHKGDYEKALNVLGPAAKKFTNNYIIRFENARSLLFNRRPSEALAELGKITILPYEGAGYGREVYHQACVLTALESISKKRWKEALTLLEQARRWPENLGVGKPYEVDERLEDYLEGVCRENTGDTRRARNAYERAAQQGNGGAYSLLSATALRNIGKSDEAAKRIALTFAADKHGKGSRWWLSVFEGDRKERRQLENEFETARRNGQWNPVPSDPSFLLVYETIKVLDPLTK